MKLAQSTGSIVGARRGRHAIRRARSHVEASRLRHAQLVLPWGLRRTRVSEMRLAAAPAEARVTRTLAPALGPRMERKQAARRPAASG
ncbi:MAG TPA: hypothetical protein VFK09_11895 [Gemmatimonadales bacterium]|nr:hypothetical protein [Gemmatimonadales bacterium]